jgi:uncharacterized protein YodC (DUF2158 family)
MEEKLEIGDYVTLKVENSPEMIVLKIIYRDGYSEPVYECGWFTNANRLQTYQFDLRLLDLTRQGATPSRLVGKHFK